MSELVLRTAQDVEDLTYGAAFFGIGGGGAPAEGMKLLKGALAAKGEVRCISPESFPDDGYVATVGFMGNRAPLTDEQERQKQRLGLIEWKYENNLVEALSGLMQISGKPITGLVCPETGGANTPGPMSAAAYLGIKVIDGDYAGKAKPEVTQGAHCMAGQNVCPMVFVDKWGNKTVVYETTSILLGERIGKMLAMAAFGNVAMALALLPGSVMKKTVIPGTISEALALGQAMRRAGERGENPVEAVIGATRGVKLFEGVLSKKEWAVVNGYYQGSHEFRGLGDYAGHSYKVWFKNENHITWLDGQYHVTSPDLIAQLDRKTGKATLTHEVREGDEAVFVGLPSRALHRKREILPYMEPRHYGFDLDYTPMETVLGRGR